MPPCEEEDQLCIWDSYPSWEGVVLLAFCLLVEGWVEVFSPLPVWHFGGGIFFAYSVLHCGDLGNWLRVGLYRCPGWYLEVCQLGHMEH